MKTNNISILLSILMLSVSCTTMQTIETPRTKKSKNTSELDYRLISASDKSCKPSREFKRWKILFATYPISIPTPEEIFPNSEKSYRIIETSDWEDVTLSIVLGLTTTITRDTLLIEECEASETFLTELSSRIPENHPLFQERLAEAIRDEKARMKILDIEVPSLDNPETDSTDGVDEKDSEKSIGLTKIWLKNGKLIKGKLQSQDVEKINLIDENGKEKVILKSEITKIQFR